MNIRQCSRQVPSSTKGNNRDRMQELLDKEVIPYVDTHYWLPLYQMSMYKEKIEKDMGYTPTAGNMGRLDSDTLQPMIKPIPCWTAFTEGHVRVDGGLSACCFGSDDRFDMGVLDGTNFMRQWNSKKFVEFKGSPCQDSHGRTRRTQGNLLRGLCGL